MKRPNKLDFTSEEIEALIIRIENKTLETEDFPLLANVVRAMIWLESSLKEKQLSISRLKAIFGIKTESAKKLSKLLEGGQLSSENNKKEGAPPSNIDSDKNEDAQDKGSSSSENKDEKLKNHQSENKSSGKGHGHRSASDYQEASIIEIFHETLKKGSVCPTCQKGKLFNLSPGSVLRIIGRPWLHIEIYKPQRLRCPLCQKVFTAKLPEELCVSSRVDSTAKAIVSILKYRGGVPFYRQEQIQSILGNPISNTEAWEMTKSVANCLEPIFTELCQVAANAECIHNDDTHAKILTVMKENEATKPERTGLFTTALLAKNMDKQVALFFTSRQHAGENLNDLLDRRDNDLPVPIQSCDALSRNIPKDHATQVGYCHSHVRRKFYEIAQYWPKECITVVSGFNLIFLHDKIATEKKLSPQERLKMHQEKSKPIIEKIKSYCEELIETKKVEPNSSLGKAIQYLKNQWNGLILFLSVPGVPLSNNEDERLIKRAVLNRKNSYFFKTTTGAKIADILMSVIETCALNRVNPYTYLIAIQENQTKIGANPQLWLPWNYTEAMSSRL